MSRAFKEPAEYIPYQQGYYYYPTMQPVTRKTWSKGKIALVVLAGFLGLAMFVAAYGFVIYHRVNKVMDSLDYWRTADMYFRDGNYRKAVEYCDLAIKAEPDFAKPYELRGMSLYELGRYEEARTDLKKALDLDPALVDAKKYLKEVFVVIK